jgi:hypothetical protein
MGGLFYFVLERDSVYSRKSPQSPSLDEAQTENQAEAPSAAAKNPGGMEDLMRLEEDDPLEQTESTEDEEEGVGPQVYERIHQLALSRIEKDQKELSGFLKHKSEMVQIEALSALREYGGAGSLSAVAELVGAKSLMVRRGAFITLGALSQRGASEQERIQVVKTLKKAYLAQDKNPNPRDASANRSALIEALGFVGHDSAVDFLATEMQNRDADPIIQASIVRSLGEIGSLRAKEPLQKFEQKLQNLSNVPTGDGSLPYGDLKELLSVTLRDLGAQKKGRNLER